MTNADLIAPRSSYVAGQWIDGDETLGVENPADESHVTELSAPPARGGSAGHRPKPGALRRGSVGEIVRRGSGPRSCTPSWTTSRSVHEPLVATMVAEAGQPVVFAEMAQYAAGIALSRNTIDLFLVLGRGGGESGPGRRAGPRAGGRAVSGATSRSAW